VSTSKSHPGVTQAAVQAVEAFSATKAGQEAVTSGNHGRGMAAVVRAAIALGKVPGWSKGLAQDAAAVKALGRSVRHVPRTAGMGVGRGHSYGTKVKPASRVLTEAAAKVGKASKAGAKQAKRTAAPAKEHVTA
jgi:hypothetical protein